jgi:hypothetical protein
MCAAGSALVFSDTQQHHHEDPAHVQHQDAAAPDPTAELSPKLRMLLNKEMSLIDQGMGVLATAISQGEWETVEGTARTIRDSFILRQELSKEEAEELHAKLPEGFLLMDRKFHETSGRLAHVAQARAADLAVFYYSRLLESCVSCHATYAPNRFPGLAAGDAGEHGH